MQRFEYRIETVAIERGKPAGEQLTQALNRWGQQGWRVCQIALQPAAQTGDAADTAQVVLERRLANWLLSEEDD